MVVADQTYGWHKDTDKISYSQLVERTGRHKEAIAKSTKSLREKGYIQILDETGKLIKSKEEARGKCLYYRISKPASSIIEPHKFDNRTSEIEHTKETNTKDLSNKNYLNGEKPPKEGFGNSFVNEALQEFEKLTGFSPTDKKPRNEAYNLVRKLNSALKLRGKDSTPENTTQAVKAYFRWLRLQDWSENLQTMGTARRKIPIFLSELPKRRGDNAGT